MKRFYYRWPGMVYAYRTEQGFSSKREAVKMIKQSWGFERLPSGFEIWE